MSRGVGSMLLLLFLGALQGVSLCHCRAEHLVATPVAHADGHENVAAGAGTDGRATCAPVCTGNESCPPLFCDQHVQAKRSNAPVGAAVDAVTSLTVAAWAEPHLTNASRRAAGPPAGAAGLLNRTTPLLI